MNVEVGQLYRRKTGYISDTVFEVMYVSFAHVCLHSVDTIKPEEVNAILATDIHTKPIRASSPYIETIANLTSLDKKNPYELVKILELELPKDTIRQLNILALKWEMSLDRTIEKLLTEQLVNLEKDLDQLDDFKITMEDNS